MTAALEHDQAAADTITAELVACTLGARRRPELRVDLTGTLHRFALHIDVNLQALRSGFAAAARVAAGIRRDLDKIRREDTQP